MRLEYKKTRPRYKEMRLRYKVMQPHIYIVRHETQVIHVITSLLVVPFLHLLKNYPSMLH